MADALSSELDGARGGDDGHPTGDVRTDWSISVRAAGDGRPAFNGPNDSANSGRRNALANRATDAANAIADGDIEGAIESLTSLLQKIDGESPPSDWMDDGLPEKTALPAEVSLLIALLEYEL